ncbi:MAG: asparagine synthetase B family protein, partial [Myxococcota bacterium]
MCGILGYLATDGSAVDEDLLRAMTDTMTHRGPDDAGTWVDGNIGLGHRRLSIIDLSADGRQPMCNEDGRVWIAFNGEIYNFRELRVELEGKGHTFRSHTDTEVIIHGYEQWGHSG